MNTRKIKDSLFSGIIQKTLKTKYGGEKNVRNNILVDNCDCYPMVCISQSLSCRDNTQRDIGVRLRSMEILLHFRRGGNLQNSDAGGGISKSDNDMARPSF